jgi:predicted nucleic-acid-binding Zn-ribbon protein
MLNFVCPKCGSAPKLHFFEKGIQVDKKYIYPFELVQFSKASEQTYFGETYIKPVKDFLRCTCKECGYIWNDLPLDSPEKRQEKKVTFSMVRWFECAPIGLEDAEGCELCEGR